MKKITLLAISALNVAVTLSTTAAPSPPAKVYVCPPCGCADDTQAFPKPGKCPECGMTLVDEKVSPPTVAVLLFNGAQIIDYAGPWEAFGEAGFRVFSVSENTNPIHSVFGQKITADYTFANSPPADVLLVPGGSINHAVQNAALTKWVQKKAQTSKYVMSVCTGAFILAHAGLLDGLTATTVSGAIDELGKLSPKIKVVRDQRYVDNGKVITTAGLSSGIDGAFHLISKIKGKGAAQLTALGMEYRWDSDSKYARAALADNYFPEITGVEISKILSAEGDVDHWEYKALVTKPDSAATILDLLGKRVLAGTPRAHAVSLVPPEANNPDSHSSLEWKFADEQNRDWKGRALVEPATDQPGKFVVTLNLARQ